MKISGSSSDREKLVVLLCLLISSIPFLNQNRKTHFASVMSRSTAVVAGARGVE